MNIQLKLLSSPDISLVKELLQVFAKAFAEPQTYQNAVPSDAYLKALLEKDHFIALVALDDNKVVGGLVAYVLDKFEQERKEIYIYDLAVSEEYRRRGIATALIHRLKTIATEQGVYVIFVQADRGDIPAIRLYESLGAREDVHHFDIPVLEEGK